jgi:hypothetical protein
MKTFDEAMQSLMVPVSKGREPRMEDPDIQRTVHSVTGIISDSMASQGF